MSNGGEKAEDVKVCSPWKLLSFSTAAAGIRVEWKAERIANCGPYAQSATWDIAAVCLCQSQNASLFHLYETYLGDDR